MIGGIIDKIVFAGVLLCLFQLPLLSDHYRQYLTGYFTAIDDEVTHLNELAIKHRYASTGAMLAAHAVSDLPSVKEDAQYKQRLLSEHQELEQAILLFNGNSLLPKLRYILHPSRTDKLQAVLTNFEPGIPLSPHYLLASALVALVFNILCASPAAALRQAKKRKLQAPAKT